MKINPRALFDSMEYVGKNALPLVDIRQLQDYKQAINFLKSYRGSRGTFNSYRREIEKLFQWSWIISKKTMRELKRKDIEEFIHFCHKPPKNWIGLKKAARFIKKDGSRVPNPAWRPFVATISKSAHCKGEKPTIKNFALNSGSIKETFAILSSFYNYLLQEEFVSSNPVALIRQKSKFIQKQQGTSKIRRLSELQWQYVIRTAEELANNTPERYERTLFILSALYSMYLRISEIAANSRHTPTMSDFKKDNDGNWWFTTIGKGNKQRQIAVSNSMLKALKRWRRYLGFSSLPSLADNAPLLPKIKGNGAITSTNYIRNLVQSCFNETINRLNKDNFIEEAESLLEATVHWLRHTGISDDVKHRPREHVRDDAGHSSSAITDKYIDIELRERHRSAKNKLIKDED